MGNRPRDNRIAVQPDPTFGIAAPYADVGPIVSGPPIVPTYQTTAGKVAIVPQYQDVRDVPIMAGFDFRKPQYIGV